MDCQFARTYIPPLNPVLLISPDLNHLEKVFKDTVGIIPHK